MRTFKEFLTEAVNADVFREQANTVKNLTADRVWSDGATYVYMPIYFSVYVFFSTLKKLAEKEGLQFKEYAMDAEAKNDLFSINLYVDQFKLKLKLQMNKNAKKDSDVKKAFKALNSLVKLLDARCKELKSYLKVINGIKDLCVKHKKAPGNVVIKGLFDENGVLHDVTLVPPRGRDVDEYFSDEFIQEFISKIQPLAKAAGIKAEVAGSVSGRYVFDIAGLSNLK